MAAAARTHATDRGIDYRGLPLLAFGGAGPVHACMVAELVDSSMVIYPPLASVLSAFGTLVTPARIDLVRGQVAILSDIEWSVADAKIGEMVADGRSALQESGIATADIAFSFGVDMRYHGQQSELWVALPFDPRSAHNADEIQTLFEAEYEKQYGLKLTGVPIEVVNWRVTVSGKKPDRSASTAKKSAGQLKASRRTVFFRGKPVEVDVRARSEIAADERIRGPVIIEERETTIFVLPGWTVQLHESGSLVAQRDKEVN
jgi:N-methylhydantoinase A